MTHSFPTRRCSDLLGIGDRRAPDPGQLERFAAAGPERPAVLALVVPFQRDLGIVELQPPKAALPQYQRKGGDRRLDQPRPVEMVVPCPWRLGTVSPSARNFMFLGLK